MLGVTTANTNWEESSQIVTIFPVFNLVSHHMTNQYSFERFRRYIY